MPISQGCRGYEVYMGVSVEQQIFGTVQIASIRVIKIVFPMWNIAGCVQNTVLKTYIT